MYADGYNDQDRERQPAPPPEEDRDANPQTFTRRTRSPSPYRPSQAAVHRPSNAPAAPEPSKVLGVFGLSIRTRERDLEEEFGRFGQVEKAVIVYDQRSDRSRGFGFVTMSSTEEATKCIQELNGVNLNDRRIRVDYSVTERPHASTPGEYMGFKRNRDQRPEPDRRGTGRYERSFDRDRYDRRDYDRRYDREREPRGGSSRYDRDPYARDDRVWREREDDRDRYRSSRRRSPSYERGGGGRSPRRRSISPRRGDGPGGY